MSNPSKKKSNPKTPRLTPPPRPYIEPLERDRMLLEHIYVSYFPENYSEEFYKDYYSKPSIEAARLEKKHEAIANRNRKRRSN